MPLSAEAWTAGLVLVAAAAGVPDGARAAEPRLMECVLGSSVKAETEIAGLGSPLVIGLDAETGSVRVEGPGVAPGPGAGRRAELVWIDEAGLRAVAVVVEEGRENPHPVTVLDLDFAGARAAFDSFGGPWALGASAYPVDYVCERLN